MATKPADRPKAPAWAAADVEQIKRSKIAPSAHNSRKHPEDQVIQIADSIMAFGWTIPILVDESNTIIAGEGRWLAAGLLLERGDLKSDLLPCLRATGWSEEQKRAYIIADNQLTIAADWDMAKLGQELSELQELGFDLNLTGFTDEELAEILVEPTEGATDPDAAAPEPPKKPVSVLGDTWVLGRHRVRCGDATSADDVAALLAGVSPHLMVTDPPYGVNYDADWRNRADRANGKPYGARAVGKVHSDDRSDWREAWALFPGDVAYVWHGASESHIVAEGLVANGFTLRAQIIWVKSQLVISRGHYHSQHEPLWYAVKGKGHWQGSRKESTVWEIDKPRKSETGHSTQKPVECMRRPIVNNSSVGQAVYEPFSGSGTTIIAGEMEGRSILAMEIDPGYVDVAIQRWQEFAEDEARHEATGQTFAEVRAERLG